MDSYSSESKINLPQHTQHLFIYLKATWQRAGSATYKPHSWQKHVHKTITHTIKC